MISKRAKSRRRWAQRSTSQRHSATKSSFTSVSVRQCSTKCSRIGRRLLTLTLEQRPLASALSDEGVWKWRELECREVQGAGVSCERISIEANHPPAVGEGHVTIDVHVAMQVHCGLGGVAYTLDPLSL